jgi:glycine betaine/proline transport system permease protein
VSRDVVLRPRLLVAVGLLVALAALGGFGTSFPASITLPLAELADELQAWVVRNRATSPLFGSVFRPLATFTGGGVTLGVVLLERLGWAGVIVAAAGIAVVAAGWRVALVVVAALAGIGLIGAWDDAMRTLSLTAVAVLVSVVIGLPLGVLAGRDPRVARAIRPVLDTLQIVPAYVYLLPAVLLFGIGEPTAVVVTVAYALPPIVRLTTLGMRSVPESIIEVAASSGATGLQLLRTVQLPLALPWIRVGLNQTIMMALGMVVIASLVGATGLGREVLRGLQTLDIGRALDAGVAIVLLAVVLDRVTGGTHLRSVASRASRSARPFAAQVAVRLSAVSGSVLGDVARWTAPRRVLPVTVGLSALLALLPDADVPLAGSLSLASAATRAVAWSRTALYGVTSALSDGLIVGALDPLRDLLLATPWWLLTAIVLFLAWWAAGERLVLLVVVAFATIGALGVWALTMDTFSQVVVATLLSVLVAVPLGVLASQSDVLHRALRPVLDAMQTMPAFVYLVPVVALFNVGRVPGLIAAVVYAMAPAVRLTDVGIREVDAGTLEAARSQGATRLQLLRTVQLPLARPTILLGINQTTIMVLAGVVIAGLVGASGLGIETVIGVARGEFGRGVRAGVAIVLLGVVLDRVTQAIAGGGRGLRRSEDALRLRSLLRTT